MKLGDGEMRVVFHYASVDDTIGIELVAMKLARLLWKEVVEGCVQLSTQESQRKNRMNCQLTVNSPNVGSIAKTEATKLSQNSLRKEALTEASNLFLRND